MDPLADRLSEKIHTLNNAQLAEVERFIEALKASDNDRELVRAWTRASEPAFEAVWNNLEDDIYNDL